jgi:hypothetical protein
MSFHRILFFSAGALLLASCASGVSSVNGGVPAIGASDRSSLRTYEAAMPAPAGGPSLYVANADVDKVIDPRLPASDRSVIRQKLLLLPAAWRGAGLIYQSLDGHLYASNLDLLKMERSEQLVHRPVSQPGYAVGASGPIEYANGCPQHSLGGYGTGPFRRVYIGCDGYNTQSINFDDGTGVPPANGCLISDTINQNNDLHEILAGAYPTAAGSGIDAGLVFVNGKAPYWEPYMHYPGFKDQTGSHYGCNETFQIILQLQAG